MQQLDAARSGGQFERGGRGAGVATVHAHRRTGRLRQDLHARPRRHQLHDQFLALAVAHDVDLGRTIEMALGTHQHRVAARRQRELPGRAAGDATIDDDLGRNASRHMQSARQRRELVAQHLLAVVLHAHRLLQRGVAAALRDQCVFAGPQQVAGAEPEAGPAAVERDAVGRRRDLDLHRRRGEHHQRQRREQHRRQRDRDARPATARRAAGSIAAPERDRVDARAVLGTLADQARGVRRNWRRGRVVVAAGQQFEHACIAIDAEPQPPAGDVDHVAAPQPRRAGDARAVVQQRHLFGRRLHVQLVLVQCDPRQRAAGARGHDDVAAGASDRHRELCGLERPLA